VFIGWLSDSPQPMRVREEATMHEAWKMTAPPAPSQSLLRHPLRALEHAALDGVRRMFRWVELASPMNAWLGKHRVRVLRNVPYLGSGHPAHRLDVYAPVEARHDERRPVVLYVHGGGFEVCSKDTHWLMAQSYARAGYVVFNVNYRLAPKNPFPYGLMDVCAAYLWTLDNALRFGGDPQRIIVAGESAGANLVSSLAIISSIERREPWAKLVFQRAQPPSAVVAACGLFEVDNPHRFRSLARESWGITKHAIEQIGRAYLPNRPSFEGEHDLANPLRVLERRRHVLARPLPPFFVPCGGADPLVDDTRRLEEALRGRAVMHEARYYPGEVHAFHALWWREQAKLCWSDTLDFLGRALAEQQSEPKVAA
jgi:acetyl esterase